MTTQYRTPVSLNWLIQQRAVFLGEIERLEKALPRRLVETQEAIDQAKINLELAKQRHKSSLFIQREIIRDINKKLIAVDLMMSIHEVKINPNLVKPIKKQRSKRILNYGEITRGILECLKAHGTRMVTTSISDYVYERFYDGPKDDLEKLEFRTIIRKRLSFLATKGDIHRFHNLKTVREGEWGINKHVKRTVI